VAQAEVRKLNEPAINTDLSFTT